jgi:methyltransferase (TIGR00027 family)
MPSDPLIRNISDTARWVAVYRARETERDDAVFRDRFARQLAGERGEQIARAQPFAEENQWPFVARTYIFDQLITHEVERGTDLVVNLAAGLDARPYRMNVPESLRWVEIDLPEILAYKASVLESATPNCRIERIALDLSDVSARGSVFDRLGGEARRALVLSEGLLIYLSEEEVAGLGRDLAHVRTFERWAVEVGSPALLQLMNAQMGDLVRQAGAPYKFGPADGPHFFERCGWKALEIQGMLRTAHRLGRLPEAMRAAAAFPEPPEPWKSPWPWSAVCVMAPMSL